MRNNFEIYPAIDIIEGKCVRLLRGDYNEVTRYADDPVAMALSFKEAGAQNIHVVDLDAARTGIPANTGIIADIVSRTGLFVQTGGGIRNMLALKRIVESGISRAIIGTAAVTDKTFLEQAIAMFGDKIAVGIDAKDGIAAVNGWTRSGGVRALDLAREMESVGVSTIIYTDIARDGTLSGIPVEKIKELVQNTNLQVIASGGIGSMKDVLDAKSTGATGAIIGKAIYEGKVDLKKCLQNV